MDKVFYANVEKETLCNENYRNVVYTAGKQQFVYMSLPPNDFIHKETHVDTDQFIRIEKGEGIAIVEDKEYKLHDGIGLIIPAGYKHEIKNTSSTELLKLYTIYSPPEHTHGKVQKINPDSDEQYKNEYIHNKLRYIISKKI